MGLKDKAKATAKNIEGKAQEAMGNVTGDPETEAKGKAKQVEAKVKNAGESVKDKAKDVID
ncbi:MAG: CsbD family protein [Cyanobacterium sp.]